MLCFQSAPELYRSADTLTLTVTQHVWHPAELQVGGGMKKNREAWGGRLKHQNTSFLEALGRSALWVWATYSPPGALKEPS